MKYTFTIDMSDPDDFTEAFEQLVMIHNSVCTPRIAIIYEDEIDVDQEETVNAVNPVSASHVLDAMSHAAASMEDNPPTVVNDVELDSEGLPWDARIHTEKKTKVKKDNTWKLKRGVDKDLVEQIKTELRQLMALQLPVTTHAASAIPSHEVQPELPPGLFGKEEEEAQPELPPASQIFGGQTPVQGANVTKIPPPPVQETQPAPTTTTVDFGGFLGKTTTRIAEKGALYQNKLNEVLASKGLNNIGQLAVKTDFIPVIDQEMDIFYTTI